MAPSKQVTLSPASPISALKKAQWSTSSSGVTKVLHYLISSNFPDDVSSRIEYYQALLQRSKDIDWLERHDDDRLKSSLNYALSILNHRDITPRAEVIYSLMTNEITAAMSAETRDERHEKIRAVIDIYHCIHPGFQLNPVDFVENLDVKAALMQLRQMQYLARYGDSVKIVVDGLRFHSGAKETPGWETTSGNYRWAEIAKGLQDDEDRRANLPDPDDSLEGPRCFTYCGVKWACDALGYNRDLVYRSIHTFAARDFTFHRDIEDFIAWGDFPALAEVLFWDLEELYRVFLRSRVRQISRALRG